MYMNCLGIATFPCDIHVGLKTKRIKGFSCRSFWPHVFRRSIATVVVPAAWSFDNGNGNARELGVITAY